VSAVTPCTLVARRPPLGPQRNLTRAPAPPSFSLLTRATKAATLNDMHLVPVTSQGARAACLDLGDPHGTPHVYIGGLGSATSVAFAPVVAHPGISTADRHLLIDLVGSGESDHDDTFSHTIEAHAVVVAAILEALAVPLVNLIGHSLGGSVAISLATQRPELVASLVVAEPNLDPGIGTFSAQVASTDEDTFATSGMQHLLETQDAPAFVHTLRRWSPRGLHRTAVSLLADRPTTFREQLTALGVPKHYLTGELTREDLESLRATGCDVRVVPAAGHVMMDDNLDGLVAALVASATKSRS
jgi:pimeloyl-ACP methyl ester carboxylesterase